MVVKASLSAARIVVVAPTAPDANGRGHLPSCSPGRGPRAALNGIAWDTADALTIAEDTAVDLRVLLRRGVRLTPLPPAGHPELYRLPGELDVIA